MKRFLGKLFFADSPGKGAFAGIVLLLSGSWLWGTIFILCGGLLSLASIHMSNGKWIMKEPGWLIASGIVLLILFGNFLYQQGRFWYRFKMKECTSCCKKFLALSLILWTAVLMCGGYCGILIGKHGVFYGDCNYITADGSALVYLLPLTLFLTLASVLATGKFYSLQKNFPYKEIFTLPIKTVILLALVTYIGLVAAVHILQQKCDTAKTLLQTHFQRPLTAEALRKEALGSRKADAGFWDKVRSMNHSCRPTVHYCDAVFTPAQLGAWQKQFESSKEFADLDRIISNPLPATPRKFEKYNLFHAAFPDLMSCRFMARLQVWNCRFAALKKDRPAALAALKRLDNVSDFLAHQPFLISALVKIVIDGYKIRALEYLLASGVLQKEDLLALKGQIRTARENLKAPEFMILWSECAGGLDYAEGIVNADKDWQGKKITPLKKFRYLLPQLHILYEANLLNLLNSYSKVKRFYDFPAKRPQSEYFFFFHQISPAFRAAGDRTEQFDLSLQALEFFINQELYRLEHGKLPSSLPLPVDPFSQKRMQYIHGNVSVEKEIFTDNKEYIRKKVTFPARQLTSPTKGRRNVYITIPDKL